MKSGLLPFVLVTVFILASGCEFFSCENTVVDNVASPEGEFVATLYHRNCGATTPIISVVVVNAASVPAEPNNHKNWLFSMEGDSIVALRWQDKKQLLVTYSGSESVVSTKKKVWKDISIVYKS